MASKPQQAAVTLTQPRGLLRRVDLTIHPFEDVDVTHGDTTVRMRCFREDHIGRELARGVFYEQQLLDFLLTEYGRGGVYVDIGAFIGNHTVFFAAVCHADRVIAVEPAPQSFRLLRHNVESLGLSQVKLHNVATGDREERADLVAPPDGNRGMTSIATARRGRTKVVRVDSLMELPPKIIKIDTEGWSLRTLRGAEATVRKHHPVIVVECHPEPVEEVEAYLSQFGYRRRGKFNRTPTFVFD